MRHAVLAAFAAAAAVVGQTTPASGDVNRTVLAQRYAQYQTKMKQQWSLATTTKSLTGALGLGGVTTTVTNTLDRLLKYQLRLTTGKINPTNIPMFGSDLAGRAQALDAGLGITEAHGVSTGRDVVVAVLDGGFNLNHPKIAGRVLPYGFDAVQRDWNAQDRGDLNDQDSDGARDAGVGHGTFVAGMVLAVAPDAWILPVKIADDEGYGLESEVVAGIDFAMAMGANVINLSFELGGLSLNICNKLQDASSRGIVIVVSAGNGGDDQTKTMAQSGVTIPVGAVDFADGVAPWSNTPSDGRGLSLFAPGVALYGPHGGPTNDANCTWSGTSFSAPLAAGAAALVLQSSPGLAPSQVAFKLRDSSTAPVRMLDGSTYPFAGRLDLRAVVRP
jgi:hypothetical protein